MQCWLQGGKNSTQLWSRRVRSQGKFKAFAHLEYPYFFRAKTLLQKSFFFLFKKGEVCVKQKSTKLSLLKNGTL